jgi:glucose-fructose oxidoreductase
MEPATPYAGQSMRVRKDGVVTPRTLPAPRKNQFAGQLDHLAECILGDTTPIVSGAEGLADLRVIEALYRSATERRHVTINA